MYSILFNCKFRLWYFVAQYGVASRAGCVENINLTNKQARKSRYGLMGPDPYTDDPHNGVGNVYYGVVETEKFNDPSTFGDQLDDWVTLSKNLAAEKMLY